MSESICIQGQFFRNKAGPSAIRRLIRKVTRIDRLLRIARADHQGRPPFKVERVPETDWLVEQMAALNIPKTGIEPIILGRHLIALGLEPSPRFKEILDSCFEAQLDGAFFDEAGGIDYLKKFLKS